ncbi:MAG TPA: family 16 glycosylhydrolase [Flavilitoribacter sp.]|nr:family 16 glycosylhydrolase [Flavilitoribacter sp.]
MYFPFRLACLPAAQIGAGILMLFACTRQPSGPTPELVAEISAIQESDGPQEVTVAIRLGTAAREPVLMTYRTLDGAALAGEDYEPATGKLTFEPGEREKTVTLSILGDPWREPEESFYLELNRAGAPPANAVRLTVTILDNDFYLDIPDSGYETPMSYPGYRLTWHDEFDGERIDPDNWTFDLGNGCPNNCNWGNNELQYYTDRTRNVFLNHGKLVIEAVREDYEGKAYTSTRMKTMGRQSFQYGRLDIRAKLPEGQGIWPAIWMLGDQIEDKGWPAGGEIDIMEMVGHEPGTVHGTIHYGPDPGRHNYKGAPYSLDGAGKFSDEFHVFTLKWEENSLEWFVDDRLFYSASPVTTQSDYPFNEPFFLLLNLAVGGNWPGNPDATTVFPQRFVLDYVRYFRRN